MTRPRRIDWAERSRRACAASRAAPACCAFTMSLRCARRSRSRAQRTKSVPARCQLFGNLLRYFGDRTPPQLARDLLDVLIVYYLFYRALLVLRGTRAMQVGVRLGVVFLLYIMSQLLQL